MLPFGSHQAPRCRGISCFGLSKNAFSAVLSTEGRVVELCWAKLQPAGPEGLLGGETTCSTACAFRVPPNSEKDAAAPQSPGRDCQKSIPPWVLWLSKVITVFKDGFQAIYPLQQSGVEGCTERYSSHFKNNYLSEI
jgi:hypothetical protein